MKILNVLHPLLDDYLTTGSTIFGINLGETINREYDNVVVDYVGSSVLKDMVSSKVYVPEIVSKRRAISETIAFAKKVYEENGYDLIHVNISQMSVLKSIDTLLEGIPVVYTQHTATILGRFSLNYKDNAISLSNKSGVGVVCPSEFMVSVWKDYTGIEDFGSVYFIPNGVVKYDNDTERITEPKDSGYYMSVGRLEPAKEMLELVEFFAEYGYPLVVVASGSQQTMNSGIAGLQEYVDEFNKVCEEHKDTVTRYEYLPNKEIRDLMRGAIGYISFSDSESYGLTIAESQCAGLPLFFIEEDGTKFFMSDKSSVMIPREELKRKRKDKRFEIYDKYLKDFNSKILSGQISSSSVYDNSSQLGLYMTDCAKRYIELYSKIFHEIH